MVDRAQSKREEPREEPRPRGKNGGRRPGAGRKLGSSPEAVRVARARAAMEGMLPHELLLMWARTGRMRFVPPNGKAYTVELDPSERIACAKGCAAWFKPPYQARPAPGEQPPTVRLQLDEKVIRALASKQPDKLEALRDVLKAVQAGGGPLAEAAAPAASAERYGRMLTETSDVDGSA